MSKVLITGKDSYIGINVKEWLEKYGHLVDQLDLLDSRWTYFDFSTYDIVIHVAAIVHRKNIRNWEIYKRVNTDLAIQVAEIAKKNGVNQFIFMSSIAVYGIEKELPYGAEINETTTPKPKSYYALSKFLAEENIKKLSGDKFSVAIIRPPNVYGINCKGNYISSFKKLVLITPIFPKAFLKSVQSMLYIDNLCELIRLIIDKKAIGHFAPQDDEVINTCQLITYIASAMNKNIRCSTILSCFINPLYKINIIKKIFGGVSYSLELSNTNIGNYRTISLKDAIYKTVTGKENG